MQPHPQLLPFSYCEFQDFTSLQSALEYSFSIADFEQIKDGYRSFRQSFFSNEPIRLQAIARKDLCPITSDDKFFAMFHNPSFTVGIDLPVLITRDRGSARKRVFIIGKDPLREGRYNGDMILNTPYGTHGAIYKSKGGRLYWDFSLYLLQQGYDVYYTGVKKIWVKNYNDKLPSNRKAALPRDLTEHFRETLSRAIGKLEPEVIITFGKDARLSVADIGLGSRVISFLHPTFGASKHWKTQYGLSSTSTINKLDYMKAERRAKAWRLRCTPPFYQRSLPSLRNKLMLRK